MNPVTRRTAMAGAAAVAVIPFNGKADVPGEDAELRQLWAKYLAQLKPCLEAKDAFRQKRNMVETELGEFPGCFQDPTWRAKWKKRRQESGEVKDYDLWGREARKLRRIVAAIRKTKAESMVGVGIKLSVYEDEDAPDEWFGEAIDDALAAIADLTGMDFET